MLKDCRVANTKGKEADKQYRSSAVKQNPLRKDGKREKNGWGKEEGWRSDKDAEEEYIMFAMLPTWKLAN